MIPIFIIQTTNTDNAKAMYVYGKIKKLKTRMTTRHKKTLPMSAFTLQYMYVCTYLHQCLLFDTFFVVLRSCLFEMFASQPVGVCAE